VTANAAEHCGATRRAMACFNQKARNDLKKPPAAKMSGGMRRHDESGGS